MDSPIQEMKMRKLMILMSLLSVIAGLAACSGSPTAYGNSAEMQRQHAREAQDELSKDTSRGSK